MTIKRCLSEFYRVCETEDGRDLARCAETHTSLPDLYIHVKTNELDIRVCLESRATYQGFRV
jgi:hypothetical protein